MLADFTLIKTLIINACKDPSKYGYTDKVAYYKHLIEFIDDLYLKQVLCFTEYKTICDKCFELLIIPSLAV